MDTLELQGYSYDERQSVLPQLTSAMTHCGGWVLERKTLSASSVEFRFEIQMHGIVELYGALLGTGVELTRATHATLTELCTCRHYRVRSARMNQILTLRLELNFLDDLTLHSLLATAGEAA